MNRKTYRNLHTKNQLIEVIVKQDKIIRGLSHQLYWRDLLFNPCHDADRIIEGWK